MVNGIVILAVAACFMVESDCGKNIKVRDGGRAIGAYQIWPIAIKEANRIEKIVAKQEGRIARKWKLEDRLCIKKSKEICYITLYWHYKRGTKNPIDLACHWRNPYNVKDTPNWHRNKIIKAIDKIDRGYIYD